MTTLDQYIDTTSRLDSDAYIGQLFWYGLSGVKLPHPVMVRFLTQCGITKNLPSPPHATDVFKRVCSEIKYLKIPTHDPEILENYLMKEFRDDKTVTRRVVLEQINNKGKRIAFTELYDIRFDRSTKKITRKQINFHTSDIPDRIYNDVCTGFASWRGCMNLYGVRQWIRNFVLDLGAVMVRSGGGVYFLRQAYAGELAALEQFAALVNAQGFGEIELHPIPLIDDKKQRDMVRRAFESETSDAIDDIMVEITAITKDDRSVITADKYAKMVTKFQEIAGRTAEYGELLEDTLAGTNTRIALFRQSIMQLRLHVKEDG